MSQLAKHQVAAVRARLHHQRPKLMAGGNNVVTSYKAGNSSAVGAALATLRTEYQALRESVLDEPATTTAAKHARTETARALADYESALAAIQAATADPQDAVAHLQHAGRLLARARVARHTAKGALGGHWPL